MRVRSRRALPPISSTGASSPNSSTNAAASAVEIICGRWLIQAQKRSWSVGSSSATRAPIFSAQCTNSPQSPAWTFWPGSGVKSQAAPSNRSASANSTPACSLPAMGCPARKRWPAFRPNDLTARWTISAFVLPTSVTSVFAGRVGPSRPTRSRIGMTGRCQYDQIAAAHGISGIGGSCVDGAAVLGALQDGSAIAADDASGEMALPEGEAERAADQTRADDGDLLEGHVAVAGQFDLVILSERGICNLRRTADPSLRSG